jgi:hypothetical protein
MQKKTRYGDFTFGWDQALGNMEAHAGELSHLEHARLALQGLRDRVTRLQLEQRYHEAERQRATREMQEALAEGEKTATFLRTGIKLVYGNDNEKLLEFGIQPLRRSSGEKRKKTAAPKAVPEVTPEPEPPATEEDVLLEARPSVVEEEEKEPVRPAVAVPTSPALSGKDGRSEETGPAGGEERHRPSVRGNTLEEDGVASDIDRRTGLLQDDQSAGCGSSRRRQTSP